MGGEPTFVSVDSPEAPEWNLTALGEEKRRIGHALIRRIRKEDSAQRFAALRPGQVVSG